MTSPSAPNLDPKTTPDSISQVAHRPSNHLTKNKPLRPKNHQPKPEKPKPKRGRPKPSPGQTTTPRPKKTPRNPRKTPGTDPGSPRHPGNPPNSPEGPRPGPEKPKNPRGWGNEARAKSARARAHPLSVSNASNRSDLPGLRHRNSARISPSPSLCPASWCARVPELLLIRPLLRFFANFACLLFFRQLSSERTDPRVRISSRRRADDRWWW